jgi:hypothetical protein
MRGNLAEYGAKTIQFRQNPISPNAGNERDALQKFPPLEKSITSRYAHSRQLKELRHAPMA